MQLPVASETLSTIPTSLLVFEGNIFIPFIYIEERICKNCSGGEVEDVGHLLMRCTYVEEERGKLKELMSERVEGWQDMDDNDRVVAVVDRACGDEAMGRAVERVWLKRFTAHRHHPPT